MVDLESRADYDRIVGNEIIRVCADALVEASSPSALSLNESSMESDLEGSYERCNAVIEFH